jgi:hypothetical protein
VIGLPVLSFPILRPPTGTGPIGYVPVSPTPTSTAPASTGPVTTPPPAAAPTTPHSKKARKAAKKHPVVHPKVGHHQLGKATVHQNSVSAARGAGQLG